MSWQDDLKTDLIQDEGLLLKPYRDIVGKLSIGVGRNLDDVGISNSEADTLLTNDMATVFQGLDREFAWWISRPDEVRRGMANIAFNVGIGGIAKFSRMLAALQAGDYETAAQEVVNSHLSKPRAERIAAHFRSAI